LPPNFKPLSYAEYLAAYDPTNTTPNMPPISPLQSGKAPNSTKLTPITEISDSASSFHSAVELDHTQLPEIQSDHSSIQTEHLSIEPEQRSSAKTTPQASEVLPSDHGFESFHSATEHPSPIHSAKTSTHGSEAPQELSSSASAEQTFTYPQPVVIQPITSPHGSEAPREFSSDALPEQKTSPTPAPQPFVDEISNPNLPTTDHGTVPLQYNSITNMYEPKTDFWSLSPEFGEDSTQAIQIVPAKQTPPPAQIPVAIQPTTFVPPPAPVEQTPPPAPKKPGFFDRIVAPVKNFFSPKPTPEPIPTPAGIEFGGFTSSGDELRGRTRDE
jgi:hypothetical protein